MTKPVRVYDTEVYKDFFLVAFRDVDTGEVWSYETYEGQPLDIDGVVARMRESTLVSFNGNNFDLPVLAVALRNGACADMKRAADMIIGNNLRPWHIEERFGVKVPTRIDHIDLIEVAPGIASLKIYGGRLHCPKMQDLPIDPAASIAPAQRQVLREYCVNDLAVTESLYKTLLPQIELRQKMSKIYGMDLRSKSDAQIAETVIVDAVGKASRREVVRPTVPAGTVFHYKRPPLLASAGPVVEAVAAMVEGLDFVVPDSGAVQMPKALKDYEVRIGAGVYRLGIGGLHSSEKSVAHRADADTVLIDRDVASYYPAIILNCGLFPAHMGEAFTDTFKAILARRLEAKRAGDKVTADSLKITVNGSFGKFGSKWSKLYAPNLMIQTTVTGQLALLMLIESLEAAGIHVVSANTDGVVIKCPRQRIPDMDMIVLDWELATGFETEAAEYRALFSRDVNNYIAVKADGGVKLKGVFAPVGLQKNPANEICTAAAVKYVCDATSVEATIRGCADVRKFVTVRQVKGGAVKDGAYLGKAVRWVYSIASVGAIEYKVNGYTVARSEGAAPLMELPAALPPDLDYAWYIDEANSILKDVGAI